MPVSGNMLDTVSTPPGTTAQVASFKVPGSDTPVVPGSGPVPMTDANGAFVGTLAMQPNGTYTFAPAPGFVGQLPPVKVTVTNSDGQTKETTLSLGVNPALRDAPESIRTTPGAPPSKVDLLANTIVPPGTTVSVTGFSLPGSTTVYPAGSAPVTVRDPFTGQVAGTVTIASNGTATFTPSPSFSGQVPPISYTVAGSDGQVTPSTLSVVVQPGKATGWRCTPVALAAMRTLGWDLEGRDLEGRGHFYGCLSDRAGACSVPCA